MVKSYFMCTKRGEDYLKKLCNEDDVRNDVEVKIPPIKNNEVKLTVPVWSKFTKFKNLILP